MTRLAVGLKCGSPGRAPGAVSATRLSGSRFASAAAPIPHAFSPKKCRRVRRKRISASGSILLLLGDHFVKIENDAGHGCVGGQFSGFEFWIAGRFALSKGFQRGLRVVAITGRVMIERLQQNGPFNRL